MKIIKKELEQSQIKYTVTIDGKEWEGCLKKGLAKITANIQLPGFRKGNVPSSVVKGKVSDEEIIQESAQGAADMAYKFMIKEEKPALLMQPELLIEDVDNKKAVLSFVVQKMPKIELKKYTGFGLKAEKNSVTKEEVEKEVENVLSKGVDFTVKTTAAKLGDTVVINFEGFVNGKAFAGGKGEAYPLELGSNSFIPGFEEQLIGIKASESKDVEVTFPKEYGSKELSGKKATFKCTVKEVKEKNIPKLDDAFVVSQKFPNISTVKELKDTIKKSIASHKDMKSNQKLEAELMEILLKATKVVVPDKFLEMETNQLLVNFEAGLKENGSSPEEYKKRTGKKDADIAAEFSKEAEKRVRCTLIFEYIAKAEKIEVTQADIDAKLKKISEAYKKDIKEIKKELNVGQLAYNLRMQRIFDVIKK